MARVKQPKIHLGHLRRIALALDAALPDSHSTVLRLMGAKNLGSGCYKTGWRIGDFVIKQAQDIAPITNDYLRYAKVLGIRFAPQEVINGWVIQRYYRPITSRQYGYLFEQAEEKPGFDGYWTASVDFNQRNLGWDGRGRLVAFDW